MSVASFTLTVLLRANVVSRIPGGGDCLYFTAISPYDPTKSIRVTTSRGDVKQLNARIGEKYNFTPYSWLEFLNISDTDRIVTLYIGFGKIIDNRLFVTGADSTTVPSTSASVSLPPVGMSVEFIAGLNGATNPGGSPASPVPHPAQPSTEFDILYTDSLGFSGAIVPGAVIERQESDDYGVPLYPYVITAEVRNLGDNVYLGLGPIFVNGPTEEQMQVVISQPDFLVPPLSSIFYTLTFNQICDLRIVVPNTGFYDIGGGQLISEYKIIP